MHDRPELEQFLFDGPTLDALAELAARYPRPCCLCTPSLGALLEDRGIEATTLDIDERFAHLRGFVRYDLANPVALAARFGIIICDPPFLSVRSGDLFKAIDLLSRGDYATPLVLNYWSSRARAISELFGPFGLRLMGVRPGYARIRNEGRNSMELFANISLERS